MGFYKEYIIRTNIQFKFQVTIPILKEVVLPRAPIIVKAYFNWLSTFLKLYDENAVNCSKMFISLYALQLSTNRKILIKFLNCPKKNIFRGNITFKKPEKLFSLII